MVANRIEQFLDDDPLGTILAEWIELNESSENKPSIDAFVMRYPQYESQLRVAIGDWKLFLAAESCRLTSDGEELSSGDSGATTQSSRRNTASNPMPTGSRIGDYEIRGILGSGGMAIVYKAWQKSLRRHVALKVLPSVACSSTSSDLARFEFEATAVARLDHPSIVPIYEVGRYKEHYFYSMKLIEGCTLGQFLPALKSDPRRAVETIRAICSAIDHAHQRGVLHRDLKPSNILIDQNGLPHVTDFGLAKALDADAQLTHSGLIVGSPAFMAPEQTRAAEQTTTIATDVHGLGTLLYVALTGDPPFVREDLLSTLASIRHETPRQIRSINPAVPADLEAICFKCLCKRPEDRFSSVRSLAQDLDRWLAGKPTKTRPTAYLTRLLRWTRQNGKKLTLAFTSLATLTTFGFLAVTSHQREKSANQLVEEVMQSQREQTHLLDDAVRLGLASATDRFASLAEIGMISEAGPQRSEELQRMLAVYEQLANRTSTDIRTQREVAHAYVQAARISYLLGKSERAIELCKKGVRSAYFIARAPQRVPGDGQIYLFYALELFYLQWMSHERDDAAEIIASVLPRLRLAALGRATDESLWSETDANQFPPMAQGASEPIATTPPQAGPSVAVSGSSQRSGSPSFRKLISLALLYASWIDIDRGHLAAAEASLLEAYEILDGLLLESAETTRPSVKQRLAEIALHLAKLKLGQANFEETRKWNALALLQWQELRGQLPSLLQPSIGFGQSMLIQAQLLHSIGESDAALAACIEAASCFEDLTTADSENLALVRMSTSARAFLAELTFDLGEFEQSLVHAKLALKQYKSIWESQFFDEPTLLAWIRFCESWIGRSPRIDDSPFAAQIQMDCCRVLQDYLTRDFAGTLSTTRIQMQYTLGKLLQLQGKELSASVQYAELVNAVSQLANLKLVDKQPAIYSSALLIEGSELENSLGILQSSALLQLAISAQHMNQFAESQAYAMKAIASLAELPDGEATEREKHLLSLTCLQLLAENSFQSSDEEQIARWLLKLRNTELSALGELSAASIIAKHSWDAARKLSRREAAEASRRNVESILVNHSRDPLAVESAAWIYLLHSNHFLRDSERALTILRDFRDSGEVNPSIETVFALATLETGEVEEALGIVRSIPRVSNARFVHALLIEARALAALGRQTEAVELVGELELWRKDLTSDQSELGVLYRQTLSDASKL